MYIDQPTDPVAAGSYSGSDIVVSPSGGDFTDIQPALDDVSSAGGTVYVGDGTYTETAGLTFSTSSTKLNLSGGAVVQNSGAGVATLLSAASSGLSRVEIHGGKLLQTTATAQGIALDMSDTPNAWVGNMRIEEYGTAIQILDTANTSFYSSFKDIQVFNCNNGISLGGTQPNLNLWENVRVRPKTGGAGTGLNMVDTRGNVLVMCDFEPASGGSAGITGIHLDATTRDNLFLGNWVENNAVGVLIDSGATNNVFIGGSITSNDTDITDNGTGTVFWGVNKTGTKLFRIPRLTDVNGNEVLNFTETASAVNELTVANAATGNDPVISATGSNTDIGITLTPKGVGTVKTSATMVPVTSDGAALGTASLMWSDLFLASGSVINWNNGDALLTHSTDTLTLTGATLVAGEIQITNGNSIRTGATAGNTVLFRARDVDGAAYVTFATLTANNTPTFTISPTTATMGGRLLEAQGADVGSANDLTLGADGNAFEITGTTQINAITTTSWQNGSVVRLLFTSNPTVKHNTAGGANTAVILLAGATDFVASAGDTLSLILSEIGGSQAWREVGRAVI